MSSPDGPICLAFEWIGARAADFLKLPTLDYAQIQVSESDELVFPGGVKASSGPCFITRRERLVVYDGTPESIARCISPRFLGGIVVLDTWLRNPDRYVRRGEKEHLNRDNVMLVLPRGAKKAHLRVYDHTAILPTFRQWNGIDAIDHGVEDPSLYGLFPEWVEFVTAQDIRRYARALTNVEKVVDEWIKELPHEWLPELPVKVALRAFLAERARYVSGTMPGRFEGA
jgi:hypothetical protein